MRGDRIDSVLRKVLKRITPSPREEKEINSAVAEVRAATEKHAGKLSYTLAGSFVRDTWMRDKKEFDVFILFPEYASRTTLERKGLEIGRGIVKELRGKWKVAYAEHPYTRAEFRGFKVDIVPCYKVADASCIKSAVDRTPFHNQYLSLHFPREMSGEVRLLKQFLKANGLYGSDARTMGFSGYLCELLTLHYKSFRNLVKKAREWEPGHFIDMEGHHPAGAGFPGHPLVVIDPVDPKRNVSAVLSPANFMRFVGLCGLLLKNPSEAFFLMKPPPGSRAVISRKLKERGALLGVEFRRPDVIDDVLFPQLRRTASRLEGILRDHGFSLLGHDVFADERRALLLLELEVWSLPATRKAVGPPVFVKKHSAEFLKKYGSGRVWIEGSNWVAEVSRQFTLVGSLLKAVLRKKKRELMQAGMASHVSRSVSRGFRLLDGKSLISRQPYREFLLGYLEQSVPLPQFINRATKNKA